jgi:hypothetical protein
MQHTLAHNLVDLAVLFTTHEFLVFVGQFDLDSYLMLCLGHKWNIRYDSQSRLDSIIRTRDAEAQLVKHKIGTGSCANATKHATNVCGAGQLPSFGLLHIPACSIELAGLLISIR